MAWNAITKNNTAYPMNNAFTGGGFATPAMQGNTLARMFSPGSEITPPETPILDPFAGRSHTRYEVPDTSKVVDLGEIVMFTMQSNNENFMTREVLPLVPWGWAVRTFKWAVWNFPQVAIHPTPETAPPRFLSFNKLSETTTLIRFAIGQHMSSEYAKTDMGRANQQYNLQQIEYSVQACLSNLATSALHGAQRQNRQRMEQLGQYAEVDVEKARMREVIQFCRPQKDEHGFQMMYEDVLAEMSKIGGTATSAILTTKLNTLVLTKPELTEYYRRGPQAPALVDSPSRSFLPNGVKVYYTRTFPERFGLDTNMWQKLTQIGNYHKSMELKEIRSGDCNYMKRYCSGIRNISIYNQESDAMHTITPTEMLDNSQLFRSDGKLRSIDEVVGSSRGGGASYSYYDDDDYYDGHLGGHHGKGGGGGGGGGSSPEESDFLTFESNDMPPAPQTVAEAFGAPKSSGGGASRSKKPVVPSNGALEVFGQLREKDFSWTDIKETGTMIVARLAKFGKSSYEAFGEKISNGLRLYRSMCQRDVDMDFLTLALKNHMIDCYRKLRPGLARTPVTEDAKNAGVPASLKSVWTDAAAGGDSSIVDEFVKRSCWTTDANGITRLRGSEDGSAGVPPLPMGSDAEYPEAVGKRFQNLTGYASFKGFKAMASAYRGGNPLASTRYNTEELKVAAEMVDALDDAARHMKLMLPGCQCFFETGDGSNRSDGEVIFEQLMNGVGLEAWINTNKLRNFVMTAAEKDVLDNKVADKPANFRGEADIPKDIIGNVAGLQVIWPDVVAGSLSKYYSAGSGEEINVIPSFVKVVGARFKKIGTDKKFSPAWIKAAGGLTLSVGVTADDKQKLADLSRRVMQWAETDGAPLTAAFGNATAVQTMIDYSNGTLPLFVSTANAAESFVALWGPLRLKLYSSVLQSLMYAAAVFSNDSQVSSFLKAVAVLDGFVRATSEGMDYYAGLSGFDLAAAEKTIIATKSSLFLLRSEVFKGLLGYIFPGDTSPELAAMKRQLEEAEREDGEWLASLGAVGAAAVSFPLPFLKGIFTRSRDKDKVFLKGLKNNTLLAGAANQLLFSPPDDYLAQALGRTFKDVPGEFPSAPQAGIGGKGARTTAGLWRPSEKGPARRLVSEDGDDDDDYDDGDDDGGGGGGGFFDPSFHGLSQEAFVKTDLVIPSDQLKYLFQKNDAASSRAYFDVRVTNPKKPGDFISYDAQDGLMAHARNVRDNFRHKVTNAMSKMANHAAALNVKWVDVPLLSVEQRMGTTFFGPSLTDESGYKGLACGLRMKAAVTRSFAMACQHLDVHCLDVMEKCASLLWMCTEFTYDACVALVTHNLRLPLNFLVVRPHMNYLMEMCAILSTGIDALGFTAIAGRDYNVGFTTLTKEMNGHLSFWANCIVTKPENVVIVRNLMSVGFGPGGGVGWFQPGHSYDPKTLGDHKEPSRSAGSSPSLMCLALPFTENTTRNYICLNGRLEHLEDGYGGSSVIIRSSDDPELHYSTAARYNRIWGWRGQADSQFMETVGESNYPLFNKTCYSGMTMYTNVSTKEHPNGPITHMTRNQGHWGPEIGPGCKDIYRGAAKPFPKFEYEKKYVTVS
jgi:hypothetical protein